MADLQSIIMQLKAERDRIDAALRALGNVDGGKRRGRPPGRKRRTMSTEARAKIAAAQRARWKKQKAAA